MADENLWKGYLNAAIDYAASGHAELSNAAFNEALLCKRLIPEKEFSRGIKDTLSQLVSIELETAIRAAVCGNHLDVLTSTHRAQNYGLQLSEYGGKIPVNFGSKMNEINIISCQKQIEKMRAIGSEAFRMDCLETSLTSEAKIALLQKDLRRLRAKRKN